MENSAFLDCISIHPKFQTGKQIWQDLETSITTGDISIAFLVLIKQYEIKLPFLFANLHGNRSEFDTAVNVRKYLMYITRLAETEEKTRKNMSLLESANKFAQKLSWNYGQIAHEFNSRRDSLSKINLSELNDEYWKPLLPLLELSSSLQLVMKSFTFRNVAQVCLQENNSENDLKALTDNESEKTKLYPLFNFLSTVAKQKFETEWIRVLRDPDLQTVETMQILLGDPNDARNRENIVEEFATLKNHFKLRSFPQKMQNYIGDYMKYESVLKQVDDLVHLLKTLAIMKPGNTLVSTLATFAKRFKYDDTIVLKDLHEPLSKVDKMISQYTDKVDDVIVELGQSLELIQFLKEIVNEDIRLLIDAVEEHSDNLVKESLVSMFIQVHGFLAPLIKMCQLGFQPELILMQLVHRCESQKDMTMKICQCSRNVHSLKGLYQNVANREEMTKEIIKNCLSKGVFDISLDNNGICQITMSYEKDGNNLTKKSMSELHDLRSRAHLIISSDKKHNDEPKQEIDYADFIEQVNLLSEIEEAILRLQSSGYITYQNARQWKTMKETKHLQELNNNLREDLGEWEESLNNARQQHYFLNYYWSDQLCVLYQFLTNPNRIQVDFESVLMLIHFVDPTIDEQQLREYGELHSRNHQNKSQDTPLGIVSIIGNTLDEIFTNTRPVLRNILDDILPSFQAVECTASIKKGELYVVALEEQSLLTVNVMLSLYENTTNGYPEPYQVIFCGPHTTWEEIQIFLQRCFTQTTYLSRESLFCLANVELLTNEVQFELVDFIRKQETEDSDLDYQLAIICRGGDHHNIVEEFSKFRHSISGMTYPEVSQRFKSTWPDVKFVTSTLPGLGKTELIRQEALEKGMNVVTFPISGLLDQSKIIQRLKQLGLKYFQCLHLDIGEVDDPVLLDTFLFQLIVTGIVSFGTQLYSLQNIHVYIEIANSLNDLLRESLVITQCFTHVELQWNNYDDLEVSSKITSDIQVVCQYLNVFERGRLESTDIHFSGRQKLKPLLANRCRELLRKYYSTNEDTTFSALNTFLGLLAGQLRKFSKSPFFEIENVKLMLENKASGVRSNLLTALLDVSKDFAARSLKTSTSSHHQQTPSSTSAQHMVQRVEGMIQWDESNHLLIVFHGVDSQTIAAFYRDKDRVPLNVSDLLKSQIVRGRNKELDDFKKMSHGELHGKLERIARTESGIQERQETVEKEFTGYALTPDNMLKMILIVLRVRANVPIIIMGETGCGKTSLVEYLARTCQIPFSTYNFHAGRTENEVKEFIENENNEARKDTGQRWIFLDEINTCHHLGLINEIMCHHTLYGRPLCKKLVLLAACNPYKLRPQENATTAGLEGKNKTDEYSELVYRVHPLPEAMMDYVWDYGSLTPQDEKAYIERMVQNLPPVLVDLLSESQKFIRKSERNPFCVSLRDVRRCILLVAWFMDMIKKRSDLMNERKRIPDTPKHLEKYQNLSHSYDRKPVIKSIVLALGHCYLSRLQTEILRGQYIKSMTQLFPSVPREDVFSAIIRMEQEDYLHRMDLPQGTARNAALRENVFVMLVSILNRIPVFVVGKPGCSKSLAIQLIRSNLRGKDSKDPFFRTLPHLYVVSYQGSESSTSEGIHEIFEKASKYKRHNKDADVLPVVLLDEVGLAENSPNNPLKVLHSLLEPGKGKLPDVAVVGISNWALDAAKMNRAIHLSRPEPTPKDLEETAISLYLADSGPQKEIDASTKSVLDCLANAYHEYQSKQGHANFHGLRDYYSLVKSLPADSCHDMNKISVALQRNFGGIAVESSKVQEVFIDKLKSQVPTSERDGSNAVTTLIKENLNDLKARHLMLITNGDSAIGILKQNLPTSVKETITIFGSRFEEDMFDDYNYRILSRIILCMERDCILILRDLECLYGSLYDMLNQNYSVVGKRKNCRVALGANSNPMCYVNDRFRCIVLVDYDKVDHSDPPFLNRFEKQLLRFSDVLNERQQQIITELKSWVWEMSNVEDLDEQFKESDMFMGFNEDTLPSLVLLHSNDTDEPNEVIVKKCKDDLMWIATPDGVLRTQKCERLKENTREVKMLAEEYFEKPIHNGLESFITYVVNDQEFAHSTGGEVGSKTIVMTYATVHTDMSQCLEESTTTYQLERLGAYKSEKQLEDRIHNFFFSSDKELLIFQCKPELDGEHMLLARSIIEHKRNSYAKIYRESNSTKRRKHVCILVHVRRAVKEHTVRWQINFLSGWKQVFLDALDVPSIAVNKMRNKTIDNLLTSSSVWSFRGFAVKCILWCFSCIKYTQNPRKDESVLQIAKNLFASPKVTTAIQKLVVEHVSPINEVVSGEMGESWQVKVACDIELLLNSSTLSSAMEQHLSTLIRQPLAKIVYFLERENAWPPHLLLTHEDVTEYEDVWCDFLLNSSIFNITEIPDCLGADTYSVGGVRLDLRVPFSQVVFRSVNAGRSLVMKEYTQVMEKETNFDEQGGLTTTAQFEQLQRYSEILRDLVPCIHNLPERCLSSYMADVLEIISADFKSRITSQRCISFSACTFLSFAKQWLPIEDPLQFYALLHLFVWTSRDKINDLLELVYCCKVLVHEKHLENLTKNFFSANQGILPFAGNEVIDERFDVMRTKKKSSLESDGGSSDSDNDSDESDSDESDSDESDSDESDSEDSDSEESDSDSSSSGNEAEESIANDDEDDDDEEEKCFEDILVTLLCEKMFLSEGTVTKNGGLETWIRNSSVLPSSASSVSNETPAYHFLRFCVDYAKIVQTTGISEDYRYVLNKIAKELKPDYLDAVNSLQIITKELIDPVEDQLRGQEEYHAELQKFLSQFYNRCLETNVETKSARPIIEHVLSLHGKEVLIMTPVIYRLLFAEEVKSPGIFFDIIIDHRKVDNYSCLKEIDNVFRDLFAKDCIHHDSYPAVMICDLIHFIQNFEQRFNMEELKRSDSKLLKCFRSATSVVTGGEDNIGLVLLSSVAFLRAFYSMLSNQPSILTTETLYSHVMGEINSLLAVGGDRRSSLRIFFLKQLYGAGMTMFDLRKLCCDSDQLPVLRDQIEQCKIVNKVELVSVYGLREYEEVKDAYWQLTQKNERDMLTILTKCQNSANHRLALLEILINMFYVKKAVGNLGDKEEGLAEWFSDKSKDFPSPLKELLLRIIGRKKFTHRGLLISRESSTVEIETALLILHVSCVVASRVEGEISPLIQYFSNPEKCHGTCILAHGEDRKRRVFDQFTLCNESSPVTCSCNLRIKHKDDQEQNTCPNCGTETAGNDCGALSSQRIKTYYFETKSKEWEECTEKMDASVYRALDLIVYACLYAGVATGISSNAAVSTLLCLDKQESNSGRTGEPSADFCLNRIKDDLQCLMTILSCKIRTAVDVMHLVVDECTELIQGKTFSKDTLSTRKECLEWENKFVDIAEDILPYALQSARSLKEMRMNCKDDNEESSLIEKQIQEFDEYPSDDAQQNSELRRLFRVTKRPSFTELRAIFLNDSQEFQEQHSVLAVLFSKFDELPYLASLYPLLRWSRLVSSTLTHRISRKEAESKFINDFIDGHLTQETRSKEERDELRKLFDDFKDAWKTMQEYVDQNLDEDEMPYLTEYCHIGYCLTEGDLSIYLRTAIKILQSIQNNILDEMILTSIRTQHPALSFLEKSKTCCAIMSVSLQEVKEKDIINFDWSDEFLKYVQNPEYGLGEEIDYDFERMETHLANEIAFGKCYLNDSLNTFIFSKELFHSSAKTLTKIRELCPQSQSLPEEIRQGLHSLGECRKQDARILLQHIEIIIYLLNKKSIPAEGDEEMALEKFAEMWKSKLPSPFPVNLLPEPRASIQLTHIAPLYEALENLLADGTVEGLPRQFRVELTEETKKSLDDLVDSKNGSLKLKQFLTALRRFVFRYLSAEKFLPEPHTPLLSLLSEPSLWSPDQPPDPDVIPKEMMLENIHAIITHLQQVIIYTVCIKKLRKTAISIQFFIYIASLGTYNSKVCVFFNKLKMACARNFKALIIF